MRRVISSPDTRMSQNRLITAAGRLERRRHLGGIRIWAGSVSDSEKDPAQIAVSKAATRFSGNVYPLSGRRFPENRLQRIPPRTAGPRRSQPGTTPSQSSSTTEAERRPSRAHLPTRA